MPRRIQQKITNNDGLTENAGHENDGPSKLQGMKLPDMKLTDQCAGHENDGPKLTAGRKVAEAEIQFKRSYHYHEVCKYLNPEHCITLCIREYLFVEKMAIKCSEI